MVVWICLVGIVVFLLASGKYAALNTMLTSCWHRYKTRGSHQFRTRQTTLNDFWENVNIKHIHMAIYRLNGSGSSSPNENKRNPND